MKKLVIFMMAISISLLLEAAPAPARKSLFQIIGKAINKRIVEPIKTQYNKNTKRIDLQNYSNQSSINYKPSAGQYSTDAIKTYNQNPLDEARIAVPRFNNAAYHLRNAGSAVAAPFQVSGRGIASIAKKVNRGIASAAQIVGKVVPGPIKKQYEENISDRKQKAEDRVFGAHNEVKGSLRPGELSTASIKKRNKKNIEEYTDDFNDQNKTLFSDYKEDLKNEYTQSYVSKFDSDEKRSIASSIQNGTAQNLKGLTASDVTLNIPRFNNVAYRLRNTGSAVVAPFQVAGRGIVSAGQKVGSGIASGVKNAIETAKTAYNSVKNNIKDLQQSYKIKKNTRLLSKEMETSKSLNTSIKTDKDLLENLSKDLDNSQYNYGFNKDQKEEIISFAQESFKSSPEKFRLLLMDKILEVATRQT